MTVISTPEKEERTREDRLSSVISLFRSNAIKMSGVDDYTRKDLQALADPSKKAQAEKWLTADGRAFYVPANETGRKLAEDFAKQLQNLGYAAITLRGTGSESNSYIVYVGQQAIDVINNFGVSEPPTAEQKKIIEGLVKSAPTVLALCEKHGYDQSWIFNLAATARKIVGGAAPAEEEAPIAAEKEARATPELDEGEVARRHPSTSLVIPSKEEVAEKPVPAKAEKKAAPPKPKKYSKEEKDLMAQLNKAVEESKEIHRSQYKVGSDYLEQFLADYAKLQKMMGGKRISEFVSHYAEVSIDGVNMDFWKNYAEKRLAAPAKKEEATSVDAYLKPEAPSTERLMPGEEAMAWVKLQFRRKTGVDYDKQRDMYNSFTTAYEAAESLASRVRFGGQIAQNAVDGAEAIRGMEKDFKKKFPQEAKAFDALVARLERAEQSARAVAKPTMEDLYAWAGNDPVAKKFLDKNQGTIENMLKYAYGFELAKVLDYIDAAVASRLEGTTTPKPKPRVVLPKDADFEAVRKGLAVLYMAKGLQNPVFEKTKAQRESLKGMYILVDTSTPELFQKPNTDNILPPADKNGDVFIKYKGKTIWIPQVQKEYIERGLREGTRTFTMLYKRGTHGLVDAVGADLLAQYLRGKGWTNIELVPWTGGRAKAGMIFYDIPAGYWDRPVASMGRAEVKPAEARTKKAEERANAETPISGTFEIAEDHSKTFGRILDSAAETSRFAVASQKEQLEDIVNNAGSNGAVFFRNAGVARHAAAMLREEFLGRGDLRAVSVAVLRDYMGRISGAYVTVSAFSEDAFMQRSKTPLVVPVLYEGKDVLASAGDRATLQNFLNKGTGKDSATFRAAKSEKEALDKYLAGIGFPAENVRYSKLLKQEVEADEVERVISGGEVWDITLTAAEVPTAPVEEGESVAERGIRGGGELQKGRAREYYGSDAYRLMLNSLYPTGEAWLKQRVEAEAKAKGLKTEYEVSHTLQLPSDVYVANSQDYRRMSEDQRAYTIVASGGQGLAYMAFGKDKGRMYFQEEISKKHLTPSHIETHEGGARFSEDVQGEVTKHMLFMHTGPGKKKPEYAEGERKPYPEYAPQMLAALSKYKSIDELADALGNNYVAAAIYDAALQLTEEALNLNLAYMAMPAEEKKLVREATFDLMWRTYVSLIAFETGPRTTENPDQKQLDACASALVDYLAGRGDNNRFQVTFPGSETPMAYKTEEAIVVRYNGKNVLAVPYVDAGGNVRSDRMYVVGERTAATAPEGYSYWKMKLYGEAAMFEIPTPRSKTDSIGPAGLTYLYVWGANPPELNLKKTPVPEPSITERSMFFPEYHLAGGYVSVANDLYWEKVGISFKSPKESVLPKLDKGILMLSTVSGEMVEEDSRFFIHPPRTQFSADGQEVKNDTDYPTFRTYAYASAYIDFKDGDKIYAFRKKGDDITSKDFVPLDARRYGGMTDEELTKAGAIKMELGTIVNRNAINISYKGYGKYTKDEVKSIFDKHIRGSWAANSQDLRNMTNDEKKEMVENPIEGRHYYVVETSHTVTPAMASMKVGSHDDIGVTGKTQEDAKMYVGSNVPIISGEWKKEKR